MGGGVNSAPYPSTVKAKGWRFELDHERIEQGATWALASAEVRPWLLMLWMTAWKQTPCGSLDADEAVIAARIGMPPKMWAKHRAVLMRGWWQADDGRLYHQTITQLVLEMLAKRRSESDRKAAQRGKTPAAVPEMSRGTNAGQAQDSTVKATPTTDHLPPEEDYGAKAPASSAQDVRPAVAVAMALRQAGIQANSDHPRLKALCDAGATVAEFMALMPRTEGKDRPFAYLLGAVEGERKRAANTVGQLHRGPMPNKQEALEARNRAVGEQWLKEMEARNAQ